MGLKTYKHIDHTRNEIAEYLKIVKKSVNAGNFIVSSSNNRLANMNFIEKYKITINKQKKMIISLEIEDFCYSVDNYNNPKERLYVFSKEYELNNWGTIEKINIYIKTVIKDNEFIVIISFHELEKNIKKLFY